MKKSFYNCCGHRMQFCANDTADSDCTYLRGRDYIHMNPVRAGIVKNQQNYIFSSASNYINGNGIIEVTLVEIPKVNVLKPSSFEKYIRPDHSDMHHLGLRCS